MTSDAARFRVGAPACGPRIAPWLVPLNFHPSVISASSAVDPSFEMIGIGLAGVRNERGMRLASQKRCLAHRDRKGFHWEARPEGFDKRDLRRVAWRTIMPFDPMLLAPSQDRVRVELGIVVRRSSAACPALDKRTVGPRQLGWPEATRSYSRPATVALGEGNAMGHSRRRESCHAGSKAEGSFQYFAS